ncbi:MAG: hypothetical protein EBR82_27225 [Caulobacteraceae bacterium]|nr:hypothetical protein [Caulobacteraceae bacterium]
MNDILTEALESAFIAPERQFNGEALAQYTEGSRLLMIQARSDEDTTPFFVWAFVFLHIQLLKNRKEAIRLCWNKDLFREKILDWIADKTEADRDVATNLVASILDEANRGQVEPIPSPGATDQGN